MDNQADPETQMQTRAAVADLLRQRITEGWYAHGAKLPSYRELAASLGAAPNTVGEAMRLLAAEGYVEIRRNSGARVLSADERVSLTRAEVHARLASVREQVRATRGALDELDTQVTDLMNGLSR